MNHNALTHPDEHMRSFEKADDPLWAVAGHLYIQNLQRHEAAILLAEQMERIADQLEKDD